MLFDPAAIRYLFPMLDHAASTASAPPIFFDNPAGTQVSTHVIDKVTAYYRFSNANMGGHFHQSQQTEMIVHEAREWVADFIGATNPEEIVFGPNMTTLNFALSRSLAHMCDDTSEIILTRMDHDANVAPWLAIARDYNLDVKWVELNPDDGTLDMATLEGALSEKTKIVAVVHASNALGTINPIRQIADMAHAVDALMVVDAVQSAPHLVLDVDALGCDFLLCSAYKFFGPHVGIMWGDYDLLAELPAYKVRPAKDKPPHRWETGTPSFETIAGTAEAVKYIASIGSGDPARELSRREDIVNSMTEIRDYETSLGQRLIDGLRAIAGVRVAGLVDPDRQHDRVPTVSFLVEGQSPDDVARYLADAGIHARNGDYYATEAMKALGHGEEGMVRVGLVHYNTPAEVDRFINVLEAMPRT